VFGLGSVKIYPLIADNLQFRASTAQVLNAEPGLYVIRYVSSVYAIANLKLPEVVVLDSAALSQAVRQLSCINKAFQLPGYSSLPYMIRPGSSALFFRPESAGIFSTGANKTQVISTPKIIVYRECGYLLIIRTDELLSVCFVGAQQMSGGLPPRRRATSRIAVHIPTGLPDPSEERSY
jgi:hypothetical protein